MQHRDERATAINTIGIGFGPAALGLAAALDDASAAGAPRLDALFLEKKASVCWQPGLLLSDTDIQHHFSRDLVTPRDPTSRFSFANYLKQHDRLYDFGELLAGGGGACGVSRIEWGDYIRWAGDELASWVRLGEEVRAVMPVLVDDAVVAFDVKGAESFRCQNLILVQCSGSSLLL